MIEPWLLELLVCPQCKGELRYEQSPEDPRALREVLASLEDRSRESRGDLN